MDPTRIFDGLKVIDAASFIAGPAAATVLSDFGAEVIKIETPDGGDPYRNSWRNPGNPKADYPYNWIIDNRNKRAIALDLKTEGGREVLHRLVADADVFVTNMPLGARGRLGIRWEDLEPLNERLIYASITAYGEAGDEAGRTGFDSTALWARTGLMDLCKPAPDSAPARSLPGMGDHPTALALYGAIVTALYRRERTGKGGKVATSLMANGVWWNATWAQAVLCGGTVEPRPAREDAVNALHNLYRCRDGRWFHLVMITQARKWEAFAEIVRRPELATDPRFATPEARGANARALIGVLDTVFAERDWPEWRALLVEHGITFGEINRLDDILTDHQMVDGGALVPVDDPRMGARWTVDSPLWIEGAEKAKPRMAPEHGEHTEAVLRELGYGDADLARLREEGTIR